MMPTLFVRARLLQALLFATTQMPGCSGSTRVVGNLPDTVFRWDYMHYEGLTHVVCSGLSAREDGSFWVYKYLKQCTWDASDNHKKVIVGLGGKATSAETWLRLMRPANAQSTAKKLVELVKSLHAVGIDLDLEDDVVLDPSFKSFVSTLQTAASKSGLELSGTFRKKAVEKGDLGNTLRLFDFVNLRAFDYLPEQAPWKITTHPSSYGIAVEELRYYTRVLGLNKSKVNLGLPFHGWDQSVAGHEPYSTTWGFIATRWSDYVDGDYVDGFVTGIFYNGYTTMRKKVTLALQSGVGITMFNIGEDKIGNKNSMTRFIQFVVDQFEGKETYDPDDGSTYESDGSTHEEEQAITALA